MTFYTLAGIAVALVFAFQFYVLAVIHRDSASQLERLEEGRKIKADLVNLVKELSAVADNPEFRRRADVFQNFEKTATRLEERLKSLEEADTLSNQLDYVRDRVERLKTQNHDLEAEKEDLEYRIEDLKRAAFDAFQALSKGEKVEAVITLHRCLMAEHIHLPENGVR